MTSRQDGSLENNAGTLLHSLWPRQSAVIRDLFALSGSLILWRTTPRA